MTSGLIKPDVIGLIIIIYCIECLTNDFYITVVPNNRGDIVGNGTLIKFSFY